MIKIRTDKILNYQQQQTKILLKPITGSNTNGKVKVTILEPLEEE